MHARYSHKIVKMSCFVIFVNYVSKIWNNFKTLCHYYKIGIFSAIDDLMQKSKNKIELEDRTGYVAVVTGGSRGIGCHVVKMLMQCNMHVVIGCRNVGTGVNFMNKIRNDGIIKGSASVYHLDTASLKSVQKFAQEVIENHQQVNILVNNAGIVSGRNVYEETEDGIENHLSVNYLGHFLLTALLLPHMNKITNFPTSSPRIVNVSSLAHFLYPKIDFTKWNDSFSDEYCDLKAYGRSKTCQIMSTKYLQKYLNSINSSTDIFAVHPGSVNTSMLDFLIFKKILPVIFNLFLKKETDGAIPIVYACICRNLNRKGGLFMGNCRPEKYHKNIDNERDQEKLHEISLKSVEKYVHHDLLTALEKKELNFINNSTLHY